MNLYKSDPLSIAAMLRGIAITLEQGGGDWICFEGEDKKMRQKNYSAHCPHMRTTYILLVQTGSPVVAMKNRDPEPRFFINAQDIEDVEAGSLWYLGKQDGIPHLILWDEDRYLAIKYDPESVAFVLNNCADAGMVQL